MQDKFGQGKSKARFKRKKPLKLTLDPVNEIMCATPDRNAPQTSWASKADPLKMFTDLDAFPSLPGNQSRNSRVKKINEKQEKSKEKIALCSGEQSKAELSLAKIRLKPENVAESEVTKTSRENQENGEVDKKPKPELLNMGSVKKSPYRKKRAEPLFLSLEEVLGGRRPNSRVSRRTGRKKKFQRYPQKERLSGNALDSSNPKRQKGKHREMKKTRITSLKALIIKERILKKILQENGVGFSPAGYTKDSLDLVSGIEFKVEMVRYLKELTKKRIRSLRNKTKDTMDDGANSKEIVTKSSEKEFSRSSQIGNAIVAAVVAKSKEKPENNTNENSGNIAEVPRVQFSSKFREYCENSLTSELNAAVKELIKGVVTFQDRAFSRDPIKAKAKKRHVSGIKEVKKNLVMKKVKMVIIAPNLEKLHMEGSTTDLVAELKALAISQNVPCVFALDRFHLGRFTKKNVPVSTFAILNYDGLESRYEDVLQHWQKAKEEFAEKMVKSKPETADDHLVLALRNTMLEKLSLTDKNDRPDGSETDLNTPAQVQ